MIFSHDCETSFWHEITTSNIIPNITVSLSFLIARTILEGWETELDSGHPFMFQFCFQAVCYMQGQADLGVMRVGCL